MSLAFARISASLVASRLRHGIEGGIHCFLVELLLASRGRAAWRHCTRVIPGSYSSAYTKKHIETCGVDLCSCGYASLAHNLSSFCNILVGTQLAELHFFSHLPAKRKASRRAQTSLNRRNDVSRDQIKEVVTSFASAHVQHRQSVGHVWHPQFAPVCSDSPPPRASLSAPPKVGIVWQHLVEHCHEQVMDLTTCQSLNTSLLSGGACELIEGSNSGSCQLSGLPSARPTSQRLGMLALGCLRRDTHWSGINTR